MVPSFSTEQEHILSRIKATTSKYRIFFYKPKKSFYIYGTTGSGKTTILEQFAMNAPRPVLFMHFHDYLLDITRLATKMPIGKITKLITKKFKILCFDEFFIESIADAKILHEVLSSLIKAGVSIMVTSNFKPEDLYKNGFNRDLVFPAFSNFLNEEMFVIPMQSNVDYRTTGTNTKTQIAFQSIDEFEQAAKINIDFATQTLIVDYNHKIETSGSFQNGTIIDYTLFQKHSSIKDYRHLARNFEHIHIRNMHSFDTENEDEAIRFRNFIDILYMRSTFFTYSGHINNLFSDELLKNIKFQRCNSRLVQMASMEYQTSQNISFKRKANINAFAFFQSLEI
jgi:cell division protein ZapE